MRPIMLVVALAPPVAPLPAQSAIPDSGTEVRVTLGPAFEPHRLRGRLLSLDGDSLRVLDSRSGRVIALAHSQVAQLQVPAGRRTKLAGAALIGTAAGLGAGLAYSLLKSAAAEFCPAPQGWQCTSSVEPSSTSDLLRATALGGAVGLGIGVLGGALTHHDAWNTIALPPTVTAIIRPAGRGVAAGLSFRF